MERFGKRYLIDSGDMAIQVRVRTVRAARGLAAVLAVALAALPFAAPPLARHDAPEEADRFVRRLLDAALARTQRNVVYDGRYREIPYPGGDVPDHVGVCTDLVVRAYRAAGIDLQREVHEDMTSDFAAYPRLWGHDRPDPNIDHRRVPNLRVFLERQGAALPVTNDPDRYHAGDLVTWRLPGGNGHIGLVLERRTADGARPLIVHNIGRGPEVEDVLFTFPITGHYRYRGAGTTGPDGPHRENPDRPDAVRSRRFPT